MTPSVGCIVHTFADPKRNNGAEIAPAIITRVWDHPGDLPYVNLRVLLDGSEAPLWKTSVKIYADEESARASGAGTGSEVNGGGLHAAFWPPRV